MRYKVIPIQAIIVESEEELSDVPCLTVNCTECCEKLTPYLTEKEILSGKYVYTLINAGGENPVFAIPRIESGCVYLNERKECTIYNHRPLACRQFDCRKGHHPKITNKFA